MNIADKVTNLLDGLPMIQVHQVIESNGQQYSVLFRTLDPQAWAQVVGELLRVEEQLAEDCPFQLHICRQYVRHEGKLRFVPHMTVQGKDGLEVALEGLGTLLEELHLESLPEPPQQVAVQSGARKAPSPPTEEKPENPNPSVQVVPLVGQTASRNQPSNTLWKPGSKGAHLIRGQQA